MFTIKNTVNEILANSGPELSLFFTQEILRMIPEEYRDRTTNEYPGHRCAEAGNIKKSRAFAVLPVIPAEL
jgi:hypothetical protein